MCLTCHRAHASAFNNITRLPETLPGLGAEWAMAPAARAQRERGLPESAISGAGRAIFRLDWRRAG